MTGRSSNQDTTMESTVKVTTTDTTVHATSIPELPLTAVWDSDAVSEQGVIIEDLSVCGTQIRQHSGAPPSTAEHTSTSSKVRTIALGGGTDNARIGGKGVANCTSQRALMAFQKAMTE